MHTLLGTLQQLRTLFGAERAWRWALLVALGLTVTAFEVVAAGMVLLLLALVTGDVDLGRMPLRSLLEPLTDRGADEMLVVLALTVAVFFVVRFAVLVLRAYLQSRLIANAGALLADDLLRAYLGLPYLEHTRRSAGELVRNVFDTTQWVVHRALRPVVDIVAESLIVVGLVIVLLLVAPVALLLALVVLVPAVWLLQRVVQPRLVRLGRDAHEARASSLGTAQQSLAGIRDIKIGRAVADFASRHLHAQLRHAHASYLAVTWSTVPRAMLETALVLTIVGVLITTVTRGEQVTQVLPTLGLFAYVGLRLQPSLQKIVEASNDLGFSAVPIEDLVPDLTAARDADDTGAGDPDTPPLSWQQLHLDGVGFRYAPTADPALQDVDLCIRRGEVVGICGPTGGGKSTLVDLLVGLLDPVEGRIHLDGRDLAGLRNEWWQLLGVVSQQVFLLDGTVRDNIVFGTPAGADEDARLHDAVERAQLREVVDALPSGLDTPVGDRGIRLSGGQRQRVAIARALYQQPDVLVFDEGTSALDGVTEAALVNAIDAMHAQQTMIAVAHRISTLRAADRILVIDQGRLLDEGTYDTLLARSALFRGLAGTEQ